MAWTWAPGMSDNEKLAVRGHHQLPGTDEGLFPLRPWPASSLQGQTGEEVQYALADVKLRTPKVAVADVPPRAPWKEWVTGLKELGFLVDAQELLATEHGGPVAVNTVLVHAETKGAWMRNLTVAVLGALTRQERPCGVVGAMARLKGGNDSSWLPPSDWEIMVGPKINTTGEILLPWPRGKVRSRATGESHLFYNPQGPALTPVPRKVGQITVRRGLYLCVGGSEAAVRPLRADELCKAWAVDGPGLNGVEVTRLLDLVLRSSPREATRAITARTAARVVEDVIA